MKRENQIEDFKILEINSKDHLSITGGHFAVTEHESSTMDTNPNATNPTCDDCTYHNDSQGGGQIEAPFYTNDI